MESMKKPLPAQLRAELQDNPPTPGPHEASVVHFGCEGCPYSHKLISSWLSITRLVEMMDTELDVPRAFVSGNFESIGLAMACAVDETTREPICNHQEALQTVVSRSQASGE